MATTWKTEFSEIGKAWSLLHEQDYEYNTAQLEVFRNFEQMKDRLEDVMKNDLHTDADDDGCTIDEIIENRDARFGDVRIRIFEGSEMYGFPYPVVD